VATQTAEIDAMRAAAMRAAAMRAAATTIAEP
jgi:hypothetical protein